MVRNQQITAPLIFIFIAFSMTLKKGFEISIRDIVTCNRFFDIYLHFKSTMIGKILIRLFDEETEKPEKFLAKITSIVDFTSYCRFML